jgi:hydrogenase maturation protease
MELSGMRPGAVETTNPEDRAVRNAILVIGYGNTLRGDDGVGPRAASAVAALGLPGVIAKAVPQLIPELAEPLAAARLAIFIDACLGSDGTDVEIRPIGPADPSGVLGHLEDPGRLLALTRAVFGTCPPSWLVTIPAADFAVGEGLSPTAERGLEAALRRITALACGPTVGAP